MVYANDGDGPRSEMTLDGCRAAGPRAAAPWLDLVDGTDAERLALEALCGLSLPDAAALSEIETSSRLAIAGQTLTLSTPLAYRGADGTRVAPIGIVLTPERLVTIRASGMPVFDVYAARFAGTGGAGGSAAALVGLLEAIVDRLADVLEWVGGDLDRIAAAVFGGGAGKSMDGRLRATLREIGEKEAMLSNLRDSLLGVGRIVPFVADGADWIAPALRPRFATLRKDIQSLADYDGQLANKVQFLLDATLGFINIEQNNGIKILTVVSVVGVPPTLVASIYGMNFKWIPELQWDYGYFYGLALIVASAIVPLLWFRRRGWI